MNIIKNTEGYQVTLTKSELTLLNNALNEICNGPDAINKSEFQTRTGFTTGEALSALAEIGEILDKA